MGPILSTDEAERQVGESLRALRLLQDLDIKTLAKRAGVGVNSVARLETGQGATLRTLIRVVRALGRQDWLAAIAPQATINPLRMTRGNAPRMRASPRKR